MCCCAPTSLPVIFSRPNENQQVNKDQIQSTSVRPSPEPAYTSPKPFPPSIFSNLLENRQVRKDQTQYTSVGPTPPSVYSVSTRHYTQPVTLPTWKLRDVLIIAAGAAITKFFRRMPKAISGDLPINDNISTTSTTSTELKLDEEIERYVKKFE